MYIKRDIQDELKALSKSYPVVTITGPRQAGKTTLAKKVFPDYTYCNLENPEIREFAVTDPNAFLNEFRSPAIFDEIQRVPDLLSYIQGIVDEKEKKGMYVLTGSHQFDLAQAITQSLAGRTALLHLLPLSIHELSRAGIDSDRETFIYKGFLPRVYKDNLEPTRAYRNYFQTYIERDLRQIIQIKNQTLFETFMKLLAGRIGQVVNLASLSSDVGISATTLSEWLSVLESSFVIFKLNPYFENFSKQMIKSPKIYFTEIGLVTYLLGIDHVNQVSRDPLIGNLFENLVMLEAMKSRMNQGLEPNLYYYRDNNRHEVDLIYKKAGELIPIEIKSSQTFNRGFCKELFFFKKISPLVKRGYLLFGGDLSPDLDFVQVKNYKSTYQIFQ